MSLKIYWEMSLHFLWTGSRVQRAPLLVPHCLMKLCLVCDAVSAKYKNRGQEDVVVDGELRILASTAPSVLTSLHVRSTCALQCNSKGGPVLLLGRGEPIMSLDWTVEMQSVQFLSGADFNWLNLSLDFEVFFFCFFFVKTKGSEISTDV